MNSHSNFQGQNTAGKPNDQRGYQISSFSRPDDAKHDIRSNTCANKEPQAIPHRLSTFRTNDQRQPHPSDLDVQPTQTSLEDWLIFMMPARPYHQSLGNPAFLFDDIIAASEPQPSFDESLDIVTKSRRIEPAAEKNAVIQKFGEKETPPGLHQQILPPFFERRFTHNNLAPRELRVWKDKFNKRS